MSVIIIWGRALLEEMEGGRRRHLPVGLGQNEEGRVRRNGNDFGASGTGDASRSGRRCLHFGAFLVHFTLFLFFLLFTVFITVLFIPVGSVVALATSSFPAVRGSVCFVKYGGSRNVSRSRNPKDSSG